jgi:hypothetical protein
MLLNEKGEYYSIFKILVDKNTIINRDNSSSFSACLTEIYNFITKRTNSEKYNSIIKKIGTRDYN